MSDQPATQTHQLLASEFVRRANYLQGVAYLALGMIFALILGGAFVFYVAPRITSGDITGGTSADDKLKSATAEWRTTEDRLQEIAQTIHPVIVDYKNELGQFIMSRRPPNAVGSQWQYRLAYPDYAVPSPDDIAQGVTNIAAKARAAAHDTFRINLILNGELSLLLEQNQTPAFVNEIRSKTFETRIPFAQLRQMADEAQRLTERYNLLSREVEVLRAEQVKEAALGSPADSDTNTSWVRLIQTNITRFGTLLMVTFLVTILVPLYRYNVRLSAYYLARADALNLMNTNLAPIGFVELATVLTPRMDFGKAPQTPIEQVIELVRVLARADPK